MDIRKSTLENMVNINFWKGKRVLITGHTGFKGSWLSLWLNELNAEVFGYALEPETNPSLFSQLKLSTLINNNFGDIRDTNSVANYILKVKPDVIIHMAAQPLVRHSYKDPLYTWQTNVIGTVNLLEAARKLTNRCAIVVVTTDKVYENLEWNFSYREIDKLGGFDPYSSSKAAAELVVDSWRNSFFKSQDNIRIATGRAGNVIGGGDWSEDRIVPDMIKSLSANEIIRVRNPKSVRPWQHVLEPLSGYLILAEKLFTQDDPVFQSAFNFGPLASNSRTVEELVCYSLNIWPGEWQKVINPTEPHEASLLNISIDKSGAILKWRPKWNFEESVEKTVNWYKALNDGALAESLVREQIKTYNYNGISSS